MDRFEQNMDQKQQNKELKRSPGRMDDILDNAIDNDDESYQRSEELAADQETLETNEPIPERKENEDRQMWKCARCNKENQDSAKNV